MIIASIITNYIKALNSSFFILFFIYYNPHRKLCYPHRKLQIILTLHTIYIFGIPLNIEFHIQNVKYKVKI